MVVSYIIVGNGVGIFREGEVHFWREGYILGGSLINVEVGGFIFWEGGVDSRRVAYICVKGDISWDGGVDSGRVAYRCLRREGIYYGREG